MQACLEAIERGDGARLRELLQEEPGWADGRDPQGVSLLMQALYHRQEDMVRLLRASRREPLDLSEAAALGEAERLAVLLQERPQAVGELAGDGFSPLHLAAFFDRPEAVRLLLEGGADVAAVAGNPMRLQALHSAVAAGAEEVVSLLLTHGAPVNTCQAAGFTPLMGAAAGGHAAIAERLLAAGADPSLTSDAGQTAADLARERGHSELAASVEAVGSPQH